MQKQPLIYQLPGIPPFKMIHIPSGTFIMGNGSDDDNPPHEVCLDEFFLSEFPVTQDLYQVITQNNPTKFEVSRCPVIKINWYDAVEFCNLLSEKFGLEGVYIVDKETKDKANTNKNDKIKWLIKTNKKAKGFRLPTEAEWEYAAKVGTSSVAYAGSNRLEQVGWFNNNDDLEIREVGLKFPNQFGLYDMSGNVYEWCWDWYGVYNQKERYNPIGAKSDSGRVARGGCYIHDADYCRVFNRNMGKADHRRKDRGFRVVLSIPI